MGMKLRRHFGSSSSPGVARTQLVGMGKRGVKRPATEITPALATGAPPVAVKQEKITEFFCLREASRRAAPPPDPSVAASASASVVPAEASAVDGVVPKEASAVDGVVPETASAGVSKKASAVGGGPPKKAPAVGCVVPKNTSVGVAKKAAAVRGGPPKKAPDVAAVPVEAKAVCVAQQPTQQVRPHHQGWNHNRVPSTHLMRWWRQRLWW